MPQHLNNSLSWRMLELPGLDLICFLHSLLYLELVVYKPGKKLKSHGDLLYCAKSNYNENNETDNSMQNVTFYTCVYTTNRGVRFFFVHTVGSLPSSLFTEFTSPKLLSKLFNISLFSIGSLSAAAV